MRRPSVQAGGGAAGGGGGSSASSASSASSSSLSRFTLQDENGKRKIRNDIMSIAESLPSLPGLYFDKKQKGFRVRYQNVYVGWVALSRFPSIEEAYCSARDIWENAKAHAEKFQTPQAAIIASLPLQKQARASGKNRGGRPRTVTQLPAEWGPGSSTTPGGSRAGGGASGSRSRYADRGGTSRRLNSWGSSANGLLEGPGDTAASPTSQWNQSVAMSSDMLYNAAAPSSGKFNDVSLFPTASLLDQTGGYYIPSPISYGKPVVNDDLNFDTTPWSLHP